MTYITVTKSFTDSVGGQLNGTVTFTPIMTAPDQSALVVVSEPTSAVVVNGALSKILLTTDSFNVSGVVTYRVVERVGATIRTRYYVDLPASLGPTVDLGTLQTWSSPPNTTIIDPGNLATELDQIRQQIGQTGGGVDLSPYMLASDALASFATTSHTHPVQGATGSIFPNGFFIDGTLNTWDITNKTGTIATTYSASTPIGSGGGMNIAFNALSDVQYICSQVYLTPGPVTGLTGSLDFRSTDPGSIEVLLYYTTSDTATVTFASQEGIVSAGAMSVKANTTTSLIWEASLPQGSTKVMVVFKVSTASGASLPVTSYLDSITGQWKVGTSASTWTLVRGAQVTKTSDQTGIVTATPTKVTLPAADLDRGGYLDTTNNRFTVPADHAGQHTLIFYGEYASNATGARRAYVYKNGAAIASIPPITAISGAVTPVPLTWKGWLNSGDYIEVFVEQSSGGNLTLNATNFVCSLERSDLIPQKNQAGAPPAAPVAGFTRTPSSGTAPISVTCTSTATGDISSIEYDFGGGAGYQTSPTYVYQAAYSGNITQRVTGPGGTVTTTQTVTISGAGAGGKPVVRSSSKSAMTEGATSATATLPTGHVSGDLLVLVAVQRVVSTPTHTTPAGYTLVDSYAGTNGKVSVWTKTDGGSEAAPTVATTSNEAMALFMLCVQTGTWKTADIFATAASLNGEQTAGASEGSHTMASITTDADNTLRVMVWGHVHGPTAPTLVVPTSGFTGTGQQVATGPTSDRDQSYAMEWQDVGTAGATSAPVVDSSGVNQWTGVQFAINAASVVAPPPPTTTERFPGDPGVGKTMLTWIARGNNYGTDWKGQLSYFRNMTYNNGPDQARNSPIVKRYEPSPSASTLLNNEDIIADGRILFVTFNINASEARTINAGGWDSMMDTWATKLAAWKTTHNGVVWFNLLHEPSKGGTKFPSASDRADGRACQRYFVNYMRAKGAASNNWAFVGPVHTDTCANRENADFNSGSIQNDPWWQYYPDWKGTYTGWAYRADNSGVAFNPADFYTSGTNRVVDIAGYDAYCGTSQGSIGVGNPAENLWQWSVSTNPANWSRTCFNAHAIFDRDQYLSGWTSQTNQGGGLHAQRHRRALDLIYGTGTNRMPMLISELGFPVYESDSKQHGVNPDLAISLEHWQAMYQSMIDNACIASFYWQSPNPVPLTDSMLTSTNAYTFGGRFSQNTTVTVGGVTYTGTGRTIDTDPADVRNKVYVWMMDQATTFKTLRK